MSYDELSWDEDEEFIPVKKEQKKRPTTKVQMDKRVQLEGRFFVRQDDCVFRDNNGKEYAIEGESSRFRAQIGHELMVTAILRDPREKIPVIKVLSFI